MKCVDCEEFGKYWTPDPESGVHVWHNWQRSWVSCKLETTPDKCPKNSKLEVKM